MSLIDEALKRAQETSRDGSDRSRERPWVPTPLPDAGPARRRRMWRAAGLALVIGAAGAGAFLLLGRKPESLPSATRESRAAVRPAAALTARATAAPAAVATPRVTPAPAKARLTPAESQGRAEAPVETAETAKAAAQNPPAPRPPQALAVGKTYAGSVMLPGGGKIELGGIVWSESDPRALVNDRVVGVGAYVEGFTVSKIEADRVALEKDGRTIFLSLK